MGGLKANRVCKVAVSSHQMGRGPVARRRAAGAWGARLVFGGLLVDMRRLPRHYCIGTPLSVVIHAVESLELSP